jgi:hypothetical protein
MFEICVFQRLQCLTSFYGLFVCDVLCMSNACLCFLCFQSIVYMCVELKVGWTMEWEGLEDLPKT